MKTNEYVRFVMLGTNPTFFINGFTNEIGDAEYISYKKDKHGEPVRHKFEFKDGSLTIHSSKKKEIEFLKKTPFCKGSTNLRGKPLYMMVDMTGEARKSVASQTSVIEAQHAALSLSGDKLEKAAVLCGSLSGSTDIQKDVCIKYAGQNPERFLAMVDDKNLHDLEMRSFIRKATRRGTIKTTGNMYNWEGIQLGVGEDEVIEKFIQEPDLHNSIQEVFNKSGIGTAADAPAYKPNKPVTIQARTRKVKI